MSTNKDMPVKTLAMDLKLTHNIFRVENPKELIQFYVNNFGMEEIEVFTVTHPYKVSIIGYSINYDENLHKASHTLPSPTSLEFRYNDSSSNIQKLLVNSGSTGVYWKIGITLHHVDYAVNILRAKLVDIDDPLQFENIGYVSHLKDLNGYTVELLQHDFQKTFIEKLTKNIALLPTEKFPLGYPGCIGQITLQTNDINKTQSFYQDLLGMKLLSIQEALEYGFTLYFFSWTNESPPNPNIKDTTVNAEWLWKRPYTTLEIRHFHHLRKIPLFQDLKENEIGFEGIRISCCNLDMFIAMIREKKIFFKESNGIYGNEIIIRDPNNIPIYISQHKND